jgi:aminopeptidase N
VRSRAVRLVALLVAAVLVAASCSGDDDVFSRSPTTSSPAPSTTGEPPGSSAAPTTPAPGPGVAGAPGVDDPYFPTLGNGGYDVSHYDLDLTVEGVSLIASVTIQATATVDLDSFDLDFGPLAIDRLVVDGAPAEHRLDGDELVIDPEPVLVSGANFVVEIDYHGVPRPVPDEVLGTLGWQRVGAVTFVSDEPDGAHTWFPNNDHPTDKAGYRFSITVPDGTTAVASGVLVSEESENGATTWVWDHPDPMPTYVVALAIGPLSLVESEGPHGITIRHAFPPELEARATATFADTAQMITDLEGIFGPYPFDTYGVLVVDGELGYAMENQTLALFDRSILNGSRQSMLTIVHELAHHWYGNWVSPATWRETWLNEGFAAYAEQLWLERTQPGYDLDGTMRAMARRPYPPIGDPGIPAMFSPAVYGRGALTLHALRLTMGDAAFFELLRAWPDRYGGRTASTDDVAALATEIAGADMRPVLDAWLDAPTMPPLPG